MTAAERASRVAADVMRRDVPSLSPETPIRQATRLLLERAVPGLPVVAAQRLVGVVSRRDLLPEIAGEPSELVSRADEDLASDLRERMAREPWISRRRPVVEARDGVLALWGIAGSETEKAALLAMARAVPGCRNVEDHLICLDCRYNFHELI